MIFFDYIFAARPLLHLPVWSIYLVSLHYHHSLSGESFSFQDLTVPAAISLAAAGAYYINQIYDTESDRLNNKLGFLHGGILDQRSLLVMYFVLSIIALGVGAAIAWTTLFIIAVLFVIGYFYSAPPLRLKDRPITGLLANAVGFGFLVPVSVMPELNVHNAGLLGWDSPFYFFFAVSAVYALTTIPDRAGDRATGKRTLAVILSKDAVKVISLVLLSAAVWIAWYSQFPLLSYIAAASAVIVMLSLFVRSPHVVLFAAKLPILLLTVLASFFFWGYGLFIVAIVIATRIYYRRRFEIIYPKLA